MIPYFSIESIKIGPFIFYTWGFFIALAFLVALALAIWQSRKIGVEAGRIIYLVIFIYAGAIAGARLFFVLQRPADFFGDPSQILAIFEGGMMFYGGLFGGLLAGWFCIRKWENRRTLISILAPVIPLAMAIGRFGCFLNNDHQGAETKVPWAILWPDGIPRHPVALYLILFNLALAGFLWWRQKKATKFYSPSLSRGKILSPVPSTSPLADASGFAQGINKFILFLLLYPLGRFLLDFTRDASADPHYWRLAVSQWISLSLLTALISYVILRNLKKTKFLSESDNT